MKEGYLSSTRKCFDIDDTVKEALLKYEETKNPFVKNRHVRTSGNASLTRLAPVPLVYREIPEKAVIMSGESSRTTHGNIYCIDACRYLGDQRF